MPTVLITGTTGNLGRKLRAHAATLGWTLSLVDVDARGVPGAYFMLGAAAGPALHNPGYTFDDSILPIGASLFARIAERRTAAFVLAGE